MGGLVEGKPRLTWEEIKALDAVFITPNQAGGVLNIDPNNIRQQAKDDPSVLGYPVSVVGCRVHIPRIPFLKFWGFEV